MGGQGSGLETIASQDGVSSTRLQIIPRISKHCVVLGPQREEYAGLGNSVTTGMAVFVITVGD